MSMLITGRLLARTSHAAFSWRRANVKNPDDAVYVNPVELPVEALLDLLAAAREIKDGRIEKALAAMIAGRDGDLQKVPNFEAFQEMLTQYLRAHVRDGWIWEVGPDGDLYPYAVTSIEHRAPDRGSRDRPAIRLRGMAWQLQSSDAGVKSGLDHRSWDFEPGDVSRRSIPDILAASGLTAEDPTLSAEWEDVERSFDAALAVGLGQQFRVTGMVYRFSGYAARDRSEALGRKVILDVDGGTLTNPPEVIESRIFGDETIRLPRHPLLRVFDLRTHEFLTISNRNLAPHVYDAGLRDKLILPETHRDLLDILTQDSDLFLGDIVDGKRAGNLILAKGIPGVGKTLTAEIYAEITEKPLYAVHAGVLGTQASEISKMLQTVFSRAKRWNCVLLIDEADVFVMRRGDSIQNNAVVAEFLRTLEYFDGLLFMTTNRPEDIDDAILSRCAAILEYRAPATELARAIWRGMAEHFRTPLPAPLIEAAVAMFPEATGRDIKMLLSLALRVSRARKEDLTLDHLRQCSLFRGMSPQEAVQ